MVAKKKSTKKPKKATTPKTRVQRGGGRTRGGKPIYSMTTYASDETRVVQVYKK